IDRSRLTDLAVFGSMLASPATDLLPPGVPGHLNRQLPVYDPAAARAALDQASFPGSIDLYFSTNATVGRVAADLQNQLSSATGQNRVIPLYGGVESYLVKPGLRVPFIGGTIPYRWEEVR